MKFLLITFIIGYVLFWVAGKFFKILIGGASSFQNQDQQRNDYQRKRPEDGNVNIDYIPNNKSSKKDFDAGEYVDYEEVK